jgi:hypothetical protein
MLVNLLTNPKVGGFWPKRGILIFIESLWDMAKAGAMGFPYARCPWIARYELARSQQDSNHPQAKQRRHCRSPERLRLWLIINKLLSGQKIRLFRFQED